MVIMGWCRRCDERSMWISLGIGSVVGTLIGIFGGVWFTG